MRTYCTLLFLSLFSLVSANSYYVATWGNDITGNGSLENPWHSFQKAITNTRAGDTTYFRGGIWNMDNLYPTHYPGSRDQGHNGTTDARVFFLNYPGETPVFDFTNQPHYPGLRALVLTKVEYAYYKGLTFRNVVTYDAEPTEVDGDPIVGCYGVWLSYCSNVTFENCSVYNVTGHGFFASNSNKISFINCDSHDNQWPGSNKTTACDGFNVICANETDSVYFYGCRAWHNSDDGFDAPYWGYVEWRNCWAFNNRPGDGNGFKIVTWPNGQQRDIEPLARKLVNCVAAYNEASGFHENEYYSRINLEVLNCISFNNEFAGFYIPTDASLFPDNRNIYRNNIAYANEKYNAYAIHNYWIHDHNSWDLVPAITVNDLDFVYIPTDVEEGINILSGDRKSDGSLPDLKGFLHLRNDSDLKYKGTEVGLTTDGAGLSLWNNPTPSIGAFEVDDPFKKLVASITVSAYGANLTISIPGGTLQLNAAVLPADATNKTITWSVSNGTGQATISNSGLVTAITNGTVMARATANDGSGVYGTVMITISSQTIAANQPPVVTLSSPTKSTSYTAPATITIDATAYDPDGTITKVEFFSGNLKLGERISIPYSFTWKDVPLGTYSISAIATDNNNLGTVSTSVSVIVAKSATVINQTPLVSIISPNDKRVFTCNEKIVIEAVATDPDGSISKVEFKTAENTIAELYSLPYSFTWEAHDTGNFSINAVATDNLGAAAFSEKIDLRVIASDEPKDEIIKLYPNPNNGIFRINFNSTLPRPDTRILIVNVAGKTIFEENLSSEEYSKDIDICDATKGIHALVIISDNTIVTCKKFIKF